MGFTTDTDPKPPTVFALEMAVLLLLPPLVMGAGLVAVSGTENLLPGLGLGGVVGVMAASLRNEIRAARVGR